MPVGYLGYLKLADIFLLTQTGGLNRQVDPILSNAVWGAGWYNAAQTTNYADGQQFFQGDFTFELQGIPVVWNLISNWLVEQRVYPQGMIISPNGLVVQTYNVVDGDPRTGVWLTNAGFRVDPENLVTINATGIAIRRSESYTASTYKQVRVGPGIPTAPLNPAPTNRNPFPGWAAATVITWPGAPAYYTPTNPTGIMLQSADFRVNNNTVVVKGCTGEPNPVAVFQGTMAVDGNITIWRDGPIPDPYATPGQPFSAAGATLTMTFGQVSPLQFLIRHVLLTEDQFTIQGQNEIVNRTFGFAGLGEGINPPFQMTAA